MRKELITGSEAAALGAKGFSAFAGCARPGRGSRTKKTIRAMDKRFLMDFSFHCLGIKYSVNRRSIPGIFCSNPCSSLKLTLKNFLCILCIWILRWTEGSRRCWSGSTLRTW